MTDTLPEFEFMPGSDDLYSRWSFDLTYGRAPEGSRAFHQWGMTGPDIPNTYQDSAPTSTSNWDSDIMDSGDDIFTHVMSCAIQEAVHEALEWLRLDGEVLLDPHGTHEYEIFATVAEMLSKLTPLAKRAYQERTS